MSFALPERSPRIPLRLARLARRLAGVAIAIAIALALVLQVPSLVTAAEPSPPTPTDADARVGRALRAAVDRARRGVDTPGLTVALLTADGRRWASASGTDPDGGELTPETPVTIGSVTKTFTAAAILSLADQGKLDLDASAGTYLPSAKLARNVTVRQLLNHTSGIPDLYNPLRSHLGGDQGRALGSNDVLGRIGGSWFAPGTDYAYSNTNYYLLGHIVEVVSHNRFNDVVRGWFGKRLHLDHTRLLTAADAGPLPAVWASAFWTSGAMVSTPSDLVAWGDALYRGDLLSDASRKQMLDFSAGHRYGLGAQLLSLGDRKVPGHSGLLYATTTLLVHLPDSGMTVAIAGTAPHTDLEAALVDRFGGASIMDLVDFVAD